jgi:hypothetical protein
MSDTIEVQAGFLSADVYAKEATDALKGLLDGPAAISAGQLLGGLSRAAYGLNAVGQALENITIQGDAAGENLIGGLIAAQLALSSAVQCDLEALHRALGKGKPKEAAHG